jgi:hypothetical protein
MHTNRYRIGWLNNANIAVCVYAVIFDTVYFRAYNVSVMVATETDVTTLGFLTRVAYLSVFLAAFWSCVDILIVSNRYLI